MGSSHSIPETERPPLSPEDAAFQLSFYSHPYDPNKSSFEDLAAPAPCYNSIVHPALRSSASSRTAVAEEDLESQNPGKGEKDPDDNDTKSTKSKKDKERTPLYECLFVLFILIATLIALIIMSRLPNKQLKAYEAYEAYKRYREGIQSIDVGLVKTVPVGHHRGSNETLWAPVAILKAGDGRSEACRMESFTRDEEHGAKAPGVFVVHAQATWVCDGPLVQENRAAIDNRTAGSRQ